MCEKRYVYRFSAERLIFEKKLIYSEAAYILFKVHYGDPTELLSLILIDNINKKKKIVSL